MPTGRRGGKSPSVSVLRGKGGRHRKGVPVRCDRGRNRPDLVKEKVEGNLQSTEEKKGVTPLLPVKKNDF